MESGEPAARSGIDPVELARFLWQRVERGDGPLILDTVSRKEVATLARAVRRRGVGDTPASPQSTGATRNPEDAAGVGRGLSREPAKVPPRPFREEAPVARPSASREVAPGVRPDAPRGTTTSPSASGGPPGPASLPVLPDTLEGVREVARGCVRCRLSETRTHVVFADGVPDPRVLVLGEAPGQNEDQTGLPFVGAAGKLLDLLLASVGISRRENAYICNVIKCRPPGNRNPQPDEIETCTPFLRSQVALVAPEVILAVGTFAGQWVTGQQLPLGKLRGSVYSYEGIPVVVTYHPAALLRNSGWTRATWDDLQLLCSVLDGA